MSQMHRRRCLCYNRDRLEKTSKKIVLFYRKKYRPVCHSGSCRIPKGKHIIGASQVCGSVKGQESYEVQMADVEADSGGEKEAGTTRRDVY